MSVSSAIQSKAAFRSIICCYVWSLDQSIALHTFIYLQMPLVTIFKVPFSINILAQSPCIKVQINLVGNLEEMSMEFEKGKRFARGKGTPGRLYRVELVIAAKVIILPNYS